MSANFIRGLHNRTGINARATKQRPIYRADAAQSRIYPALLRSPQIYLRADMPTVDLYLSHQPHA
jgi:hypothetical protein